MTPSCFFAVAHVATQTIEPLRSISAVAYLSSKSREAKMEGKKKKKKEYPRNKFLQQAKEKDYNFVNSKVYQLSLKKKIFVKELPSGIYTF